MSRPLRSTGVSSAISPGRDREPKRARTNWRTGLQEGDEVVEADGHLVVGPGGDAGRMSRTLLGGDRSFVLHPVEAPGSAGHEPAGSEGRG